MAVVQSARHGSVMTAPAATKNSTELASSATASSGASGSTGGTGAAAPLEAPPATIGAPAQEKHSARTPSAHNSEGRRSANSFTPNAAMEAALSHAYRGGLAQNGVPAISCGVTKLPVSSITRAISP